MGSFSFVPSFFHKLGMKSTSLYIKILFITFLTTFLGMRRYVEWVCRMVMGLLGRGRGGGEEGVEDNKKGLVKTKPVYYIVLTLLHSNQIHYSLYPNSVTPLLPLSPYLCKA